MSTHDCPANPCPICGQSFLGAIDWRARAEAAEAAIEKLKEEVKEWQNAAYQSAAFLERSIEAAVSLPFRIAERDAARAEAEQLKTEHYAVEVQIKPGKEPVRVGRTAAAWRDDASAQRARAEAAEKEVARLKHRTEYAERDWAHAHAAENRLRGELKKLKERISYLPRADSSAVADDAKEKNYRERYVPWSDIAPLLKEEEQ